MSTIKSWRRKLARRRGLYARARRRHKARPTASTRHWVRKRRAQVREALRQVRRLRPKLNRTVAFDGVPMFKGQALMLADARRNGWSGSASSGDRRHGVAERYGRMSQLALYLGWLARRAGFNPANPPGRSTHELRSDGVAYRGPAGRPLAWWQLGLDCTEADELRAVLRRLGYDAFRPYADAREQHHTNLRRSPKRTLIRRGLA